MSWFVSYIPLKYFPVSTCFLWSSSKPELFWPFSKALPCCYGKLPVKISRNAFCFQVEGPEKSRWIVTESVTSRYARLPCRWDLIQPSSLSWIGETFPNSTSCLVQPTWVTQINFEPQKVLSRANSSPVNYAEENLRALIDVVLLPIIERYNFYKNSMQG